MTKPNMPELLKKLNAMYDKEEKLILEYKQLQEDKELLQTMIMHQSNKNERLDKWIKQLKKKN